MTTKLDFAKEIKPLIDKIFDLKSDKDERYDANRIWNLEAMKDMENDGKTYYVTFRKTVEAFKPKRLIEIHIERWKLIDQDTKVLCQDIWVYEKVRNVGIIIDNLDFTDYSKSTFKASHYSNYFPLFIPNKARLRDEAMAAKLQLKLQLMQRKKIEKAMAKAKDAICEECKGTGKGYWSDGVYGSCMDCCCVDCGKFDRFGLVCDCVRTPSSL